EEDEVAGRLAQRGNRLGAIAALADNREVGIVGEQGAEPFAAKGFVVNDQRSDRSRHRSSPAHRLVLEGVFSVPLFDARSSSFITSIRASRNGPMTTTTVPPP